MAEIMAYQGRYQDAARLYTQSGAVDKAMEMFSDLRQFDEAKKWAEEYGRTRGENAQVGGFVWGGRSSTLLNCIPANNLHLPLEFPGDGADQQTG